MAEMKSILKSKARIKPGVKTYSKNEVTKLLGFHPNDSLDRLMKAGLIVRVSHGEYEAAGVDKLSEASELGYTTPRAAKYLGMSTGEIYLLAKIGCLRRVWGRFSRSNFTTESVEQVKNRYTQQQTDELKMLHEALDVLADVLSAWALEGNTRASTMNIHLRATRVYRSIVKKITQ